MIKTKQDLKRYLNSDMEFYYQQDRLTRFIDRLTRDPAYFIAKYIRLLRKEEYFVNVRRDPVGKLMYLYYLRRKNRLGNRLGFKIPQNCFDAGLTIYHHGEIIINEKARIGKNCKLHGGNCIGNNGMTDVPPVIGDNLDLGIGAKILGDVRLGNDIVVGANAVIVNSFPDDHLVLAGIPAALIKKQVKKDEYRDREK